MSLTSLSSSTIRTRLVGSIVMPTPAAMPLMMLRIPFQPSLHAFVERNERINVDGHVFRALERRGQLRRHDVVLFEPRLGARTVAGGFHLEQLLRHRRDRRGHLRVVD